MLLLYLGRRSGLGTSICPGNLPCLAKKALVVLLAIDKLLMGRVGVLRWYEDDAVEEVVVKVEIFLGVVVLVVVTGCFLVREAAVVPVAVLLLRLE